MAEPGAELARDVVACPGADTCNLAVTQSRGLADDIGRALEEAGLADVGGIRDQHQRLHQLLRSAPHLRHRVLWAPSGGPTAAPPPATRCCSAGGSARPRSSSAPRPSGCRPSGPARRPCGWSGRFAAERVAGERFDEWLDRVAARPRSAKELSRPRRFAHPRGAPDFYIDFDETGPYVAETGESECAT